MSMRTSDAFLSHESCPACGSRDNLARYKSGSAYCFGCGYYENGKKSGYVLEEENQGEEKPIKLPDGCNTEYTDEVLNWVAQYGLSTAELLKHNVLYNKFWNQLIFTFYGGNRELVLYQCRNFDLARKQQRKYFTQGDVAAVLPIYASNKSVRTLVVVEDCISAIKVARYVDAMPALSSNVSKEKLARLRYLYDNIVFWLDGNMYDNAQKLDKQAKLLGFWSGVIYTEVDPKCVCRLEMEQLIKSFESLVS